MLEGWPRFTVWWCNERVLCMVLILRGICWVTAGIPGVHGSLRLSLRTSGPPALGTSPWLWCRLPGPHLPWELGVAGENSYCAPTSLPTLGNTHSSWPSWIHTSLVIDVTLFVLFFPGTVSVCSAGESGRTTLSVWCDHAVVGVLQNEYKRELSRFSQG